MPGIFATLVFCVMLAFAMTAVVRPREVCSPAEGKTSAFRHRVGYVLMNLLALASVFAIAFQRLGPQWVRSPNGWSSWLFVGVAGLWFVGIGAWLRPKRLRIERIGRGVALSAFVLVGIVLLRLYGFAGSTKPPEWSKTEIAERLFLNPWDPSALLGSAWQARREENLGAAERRLVWATAAGVDTVERLEFESELHAARGECVPARAAFSQSLALVTARQLVSGTMELGGYVLPPTLVERCGLAPGNGLSDP